MTKFLVTFIIPSVNIKFDDGRNKERTLFNKTIIGLCLILLVAGGFISIIPAQDPYSETVQVYPPWNMQSLTLEPHDSTFNAAYMPSGSWFQLNISSSGPVRVVLSYIIRDPDPRKVPFFDQTGDSFHQKLSAGGTVYVDIENDNSFSVKLQGNVLMQQEEEKYRTIYPYVIPGFLLVLGGTGALIFGIFKKSKRPSKLRGTQKSKKKQKSN